MKRACWASLTLVCAVVVVACDKQEEEPSQESKPLLEVQLPRLKGPHPVAAAPIVWVSQTAIGVSFPAAPKVAGGAPPPRANAALVALEDGRLLRQSNELLLSTLREALEQCVSHQKYAASVAGGTFDGSLNLYVDARVPYSTLVRVVYSSGQAGYSRYLLAVGELTSPSAILFDAPRLSLPQSQETKRPVDYRANLTLTWTGTGVKAWAVPRPAGRAGNRPVVFKASKLSSLSGRPEPIDPRPEQVELVVESGRCPLIRRTPKGLDVTPLTELGKALCQANGEPYTVHLVPTGTTPCSEIAVVAAAARQPATCRGPRVFTVAGNGVGDRPSGALEPPDCSKAVLVTNVIQHFAADAARRRIRARDRVAAAHSGVVTKHVSRKSVLSVLGEGPTTMGVLGGFERSGALGSSDPFGKLHRLGSVRATVKTRLKSVAGRLDAAVIKSTLNRRQSSLRYCVLRAAEHGTGLKSGRATVKFVVLPTGRAVNAEVVSAVKSDVLKRCLTRTIGRIRFPSSDKKGGGITRVTCELVMTVKKKSK